jgi:hypothetical protein
MLNRDEELLKETLESRIGRYDIVGLALKWMDVKKFDNEYRNLTQSQLIARVLYDVVSGEATYEAIEELKKKNKAHRAAAAGQDTIQLKPLTQEQLDEAEKAQRRL